MGRQVTFDETRMFQQAKDLYYWKEYMRNPAQAERRLNECLMDLKRAYSQVNYIFVSKAGGFSNVTD
jgi:hypothetical protein